MGTKNMHATAFNTMLTYERNKVKARAVEKAFQLETFFVGLPVHEYCMVTHQMMSIAMVSPLSRRS